jgi:hypothetical protein
MEAAERRYLRLADRVLTVSETDRDAFNPFSTQQANPAANAGDSQDSRER